MVEILAILISLSVSFYLGYQAGKSKAMLTSREAYSHAVKKSKAGVDSVSDPSARKLLLEEAYRD